jgi:hypothetical protein
VVENEVLVRAGDEDGEALEELAPLEEDVGAAVGERALELEEDAVAAQRQAALGDRWPEEVAAEALEAAAGAGRDRCARVEVEAAEVGMARAVGPALGDARRGAETDEPLTGAGSRRGATGDRGGAEAGHGRWLVAAAIIDRLARVGRDDAAPYEEAHDACPDRVEEPGDVATGRGARGVEAKLAVLALGEHAVEDEGVEVRVAVEGAAGALDLGLQQ